jgi:hypothetical protein
MSTSEYARHLGDTATAALTLTGTGASTTLGTGFFATAVLRGLGLGLAEDSPFAFLAEWEAGVENIRLPPLNGAEATGWTTRAAALAFASWIRVLIRVPGVADLAFLRGMFAVLLFMEKEES